MGAHLGGLGKKIAPLGGGAWLWGTNSGAEAIDHILKIGDLANHTPHLIGHIAMITK